MKLIFIRHGKTQGNLEKRYIGRTDQPLCGEGIEEITERIYPQADVAAASPMKRCLQSAEIIYPQKEIYVCGLLRETDFGDFEGKSFSELSDDPRYRQWIDGEIAAPPNGESREDFTARCCKGFSETVKKYENKTVAFVVHGGTIMAIMSQFVYPKRDFYDFQAKNGGGFTAEFSGERIINFQEL